MDLWLNIALADLLKLLKRVDGFVLNDSEAGLLTKEDNLFVALKKIHKLGPKYVIIKKGLHGSVLSGPKGVFICPRIRCNRRKTRLARAIPLSAV
jgi:sugar/nucleoside kinase (ribokinase family)